MQTVNLSTFDYKKAKGVLFIIILVLIVVVVIVFGKDIVNLIGNIINSISGATKSLTTPLGNSANNLEIDNANQTIANQDTSSTVETDPFNSLLYVNNVGVYDSSLNDEAALQIAKQVHSSIGIAISNASKAYSAFQGCLCQLDVAHVCQQYAIYYGSNCWDDMSQGYDSAANKEILAQISTFAHKLPLSL